ncbi:hypothetical protein BHE74_00009107, partial [Ensete ventricosum]
GAAHGCFQRASLSEATTCSMKAASHGSVMGRSPTGTPNSSSDIRNNSWKMLLFRYAIGTTNRRPSRVYTAKWPLRATREVPEEREPPLSLPLERQSLDLLPGISRVLLRPVDPKARQWVKREVQNHRWRWWKWGCPGLVINRCIDAYGSLFPKYPNEPRLCRDKREGCSPCELHGVSERNELRFAVRGSCRAR